MCNVILKVDFIQKRHATQEPYDSDLMAKEFMMQFAGIAITVGQTLAFRFDEGGILKLTVENIKALTVDKHKDDTLGSETTCLVGCINGNSIVQFVGSETSQINLVGNSRG